MTEVEEMETVSPDAEGTEAKPPTNGELPKEAEAHASKPMTPEGARAFLHEQAVRRADECKREVAELLERYQCELVPIFQWSTKTGMIGDVDIVPR